MVIYEARKERGLREPEITSLDGGILVTVFKNEASQIGGQIGGQEEGIIIDLTDKQKEVLAYIITDPKISRKLLSEKLGINESAVQKHIDALKNMGIIKREGETGGFWKILK